MIAHRFFKYWITFKPAYITSGPFTDSVWIVYEHEGTLIELWRSSALIGTISIAELSRFIVRKKHMQRYARSAVVTNVL